MNRFLTAVVIILLAVTVGCATQFVGRPNVPGGINGCQTLCRGQGMVVAGMIFLGEYSDGCICAVPGQERTTLKTAAGAGPAAVGVIVQQQLDEENRQR